MNDNKDACSFGELFLADGLLTAIRNDLERFKEELSTAQFTDSDFNSVLDWALLIFQRNNHHLSKIRTDPANVDVQAWRRKNWSAEDYKVFLARPQQNSTHKTVHSALHVLSVLTFLSQEKSALAVLFPSLKYSEQFQRFLTVKVEEPFCLWYIDAVLEELSNSNSEIIEAILNSTISKRAGINAMGSGEGDVLTDSRNIAEAERLAQIPYEKEASSNQNAQPIEQAVLPLGHESESAMTQFYESAQGIPGLQSRGHVVKTPVSHSMEGNLCGHEIKESPERQQSDAHNEAVSTDRSNCAAAVHTDSLAARSTAKSTDVILTESNLFENTMLERRLVKTIQMYASKSRCQSVASDQLEHFNAETPAGPSVILLSICDEYGRLRQPLIELQFTPQQPVFRAFTGNRDFLMCDNFEIGSILRVSIPVCDLEKVFLLNNVAKKTEKDSSNGDIEVFDECEKLFYCDRQSILPQSVDFEPATGTKQLSTTAKQWHKVGLTSKLKSRGAVMIEEKRPYQTTAYLNSKKWPPSALKERRKMYQH